MSRQIGSGVLLLKYGLVDSGGTVLVRQTEVSASSAVAY
jgi:hypothetical protein